MQPPLVHFFRTKTSLNGRKPVSRGNHSVRTLYVSFVPLDTQSGIVGHISSILQMFCANSGAVDVICPRGANGHIRQLASRVEIAAKGDGVIGCGLTAMRALSRIMKEEYTAVAAPAVKTPFLIPIVLLARLRGCAVIYDMQDLVPEITFALAETPTGTRHLYGALCSVAERVLVRSSALIVCTAEGAVEILSHRYPNAAKRSVIMYNAHSLAATSTARKEPTDEDFQIVYLGGLQPLVRGLEVQLKALALLRAEGVEARLTVISPETPGQFGKMARNLGVEHAVAFTGFLPRADAHAVVSQCHVAIMNQVPYAVPSKFFECLSLGVLTVTRSDCPDLARFVGPELTFDGSAEDLAKLLARIIPRYSMLAASQAARLKDVLEYADACALRAETQIARLIGGCCA